MERFVKIARAYKRGLAGYQDVVWVFIALRAAYGLRDMEKRQMEAILASDDPLADLLTYNRCTLSALTDRLPPT